MRWNGSRHFELRATPQMGRICVFQVKRSSGGPAAAGQAPVKEKSPPRAAAAALAAFGWFVADGDTIDALAAGFDGFDHVA